MEREVVVVGAGFMGSGIVESLADASLVIEAIMEEEAAKASSLRSSTTCCRRTR